MFRLQVTIIRQIFQYMDNVHVLNILLCFDWTMFKSVLQHNGMAPSTYYVLHIIVF